MVREMNKSLHKSLVAGGALALFALVATALVAVTFSNTKERIVENEKQFLLRSLHELVSPDIHTNDMYTDNIKIAAPGLSGKQQTITVYRARMDQAPVAVIMHVIAPDGYSGAIHLLVAIHVDGDLIGVRVIKHQETPGLGDGIEVKKSSWILGFDGKSLRDPMAKKWAVKKDDGYFDQLTGATITPRAIVKVVKRTLEFYADKRHALYDH